MGEKYEKFFFNIDPNSWDYTNSIFYQIAIDAHSKNSYKK